MLYVIVGKDLEYFIIDEGHPAKTVWYATTYLPQDLGNLIYCFFN